MTSTTLIRSLVAFASLAFLLPPAAGELLADGILVPAGHQPVAIVAAELDGQPGVDIATVADGTGTLSILCNQGDGTFAAPVLTVIEADVNQYSLYATDLDDDLDTDLVVGRGGEPLQIFLNDGSGNFTPGQTLATNGQYTKREICAGDIDHDGDKDILWGNQLFGGGLWLAVNEGGTFAAPVELYHSKADDPVLAHLDGDPHLDVAFHRHYNSEVVVLLGNGDGTFQSPVSYPTSAQDPLADLSVAELDGDGHLDLSVFSGSNDPEVWGFVNQGDGTFGDDILIMYAYDTADGVALIQPDLNGSGCGDHVLCKDGVRGVCWNDCTIDPQYFDWLPPLYCYPSDVTAADLDGDTDLDVIYAVPDSSAVLVHENLRLDPVAVPEVVPHAGGGPRFAAVRTNPSSPRTVLAFTVPEAGHVRLEVFDLRGRRVATVVDCGLGAGGHEATWDGRDLPCGVYFARLTAAGGTAITTLTVVR